jgi:acyl-CoA oxidase
MWLARSLRTQPSQQTPRPTTYLFSQESTITDLFQIAELWLAEKGNSIAEGDFVVLCIRLASEVLLGRYEPPKACDPQSLLARHEAGVWDEARQICASLKGGHRGPEFNARILPLSLPLVQATGQRMAYEAAKDALVHGSTALDMTPEVLDLYESTCMMEDQSWYVENGIMSRQELLDRNIDAVTSMLPLLGDMINDRAVDAFINAPMVEQDRLAAFFSSLPSFHGPETTVQAKL